MANIIEFPKGDMLIKSEESAPSIPFSFRYTCGCGTVLRVNTENTLFKNMELYCKECGTFHKVTNPVFSESNSKTS